MNLVRVRHPQTGTVSRISESEFMRHLRPLGFTLDGEAADATPEATETPDAPQEAAGASQDDDGDGASDDTLADLVGQPLAVALRGERLGTPEEINAASDEELRAVDGVGPGRLKRLREYAASAATTEEQNQ